ncbi:hypothetical protein E3P99_03779 [Wallemia hederae]|uniref:RING-type domain-containing protein n=1 Tax=Wallemia hederae TaxID=1540922 RepID=A0A4T0FE07_9BASI|nr:hypothetical protein E3P99_03779 [Wallemia hederae]
MDCSICFDKLSEGATAAVKCGHVYHLACIQKWLQHTHSHKHCPSCRQPIQTQNDLTKLHLGDSDSSRDVKVDKVIELSRRIHEISKRREAASLKVVFEDAVEVVTGCIADDDGTTRLLKVLSKELRGLNERVDQSVVVAHLNDKIDSLTQTCNGMEAQKKKEIGKLKLDHTRQVARMSQDEHELRQKYEKALADNSKLGKDYSMNITVKDARISQIESNERRLKSRLQESEAQLNRYKANISEWKRKYEKLQRSGGGGGGGGSSSKTTTPPSKDKEKEKVKQKQTNNKVRRYTLSSSDTEDVSMDIDSDNNVPSSTIPPGVVNRIASGSRAKRKSDEVQILPPSDDVDLALDEPLPSFAVKKVRSSTSVRDSTGRNVSSSAQVGPKVHSYSRNKLNTPINTTIPSNSLLALGPKSHNKLIPSQPIRKR